MSRPYRKIAVASTFSPRFLQVLAEAKRIRDRFGSELQIIYAGARADAAQRKFADAFQRLGLPPETMVHYHHGEPGDVILRVADEADLDLVMAGALEREAVLRPFLGNVARRLVRDGRRSLMLFTKPDEPPKPFRRIVMMAHYADVGRAALKKTLQLAAAEKSERLYVVRVHTSFDAVRSSRRTAEEEEIALEQFVDTAGATDVPMEVRCLRGTTGFAALEFLQAIEADLLVVSVDPRLAPGELPKRIAWITDTIPCNLWVIR